MHDTISRPPYSSNNLTLTEAFNNRRILMVRWIVF